MSPSVMASASPMPAWPPFPLSESSSEETLLSSLPVTGGVGELSADQ